MLKLGGGRWRAEREKERDPSLNAMLLMQFFCTFVYILFEERESVSFAI